MKGAPNLECAAKGQYRSEIWAKIRNVAQDNGIDFFAEPILVLAGPDAGEVPHLLSLGVNPGFIFALDSPAVIAANGLRDRFPGVNFVGKSLAQYAKIKKRPCFRIANLDFCSNLNESLRSELRESRPLFALDSLIGITLLKGREDSVALHVAYNSGDSISGRLRVALDGLAPDLTISFCNQYWSARKQPMIYGLGVPNAFFNSALPRVKGHVAKRKYRDKKGEIRYTKTWAIWFDEPRAEDGKRVQKCIGGFRTRIEAERELACRVAALVPTADLKRNNLDANLGLDAEIVKLLRKCDQIISDAESILGGRK